MTAAGGVVTCGCGGSARSSLAGSVQLAERTMCSRYSFMNRHLPKLLMMVIAMIILSAGAARQGRRNAAERAPPAGAGRQDLRGESHRTQRFSRSLLTASSVSSTLLLTPVYSAPARAAADGALLRPRKGAFAHRHRAEGLREGGDPWGERDHRTGVGASHEAYLWW